MNIEKEFDENLIAKTKEERKKDCKKGKHDYSTIIINCETHCLGCGKLRADEENDFEEAIGSMRQWLNEDVVNKKHRYLTNEDLKIWFKN